MFYQSNTFTITRNRSRRGHEHESSGAYIGNVAAPWMRQLGSRVRLIRKLEIDFDALCPANCPTVHCTSTDVFNPSKGPIDVTVLLIALWANDVYPDIHIVYHEDKIQNTCGNFSLSSSDKSSAKLDKSGPALDRLLRSMVHDELRLKRYLRTISYIGLDRDASGGRIVFTSTSNRSRSYSRQKKHLGPFFDDISYFHATEGQKPQMLRREPANLLNIPEFICYRILSYVVTSTDVQKISVDTASNVTGAMTPLFINRKILLISYRSYLEANNFLIEMKSTTPTAGFCTFDRLIFLLNKVNKPDNLGLRRCQFRTWPDLKSWPSYRISIAFYLPNTRPWSLDDIRIDAVTFVRATPKLQPREPINIDLHIQNPSGVKAAHLSQTVSVEQLRDNVLAAWSGLDPNPQDMTDICPTIWVNGHGAVVDVVAAEACIEPYHKHGKKNRKLKSSTSSPGTAYEAFDALRNLCNGNKAK